MKNAVGPQVICTKQPPTHQDLTGKGKPPRARLEMATERNRCTPTQTNQGRSGRYPQPTQASRSQTAWALGTGLTSPLLRRGSVPRRVASSHWPESKPISLQAAGRVPDRPHVTGIVTGAAFPFQAQAPRRHHQGETHGAARAATDSLTKAGNGVRSMWMGVGDGARGSVQHRRRSGVPPTCCVPTSRGHVRLGTSFPSTCTSPPHRPRSCE